MRCNSKDHGTETKYFRAEIMSFSAHSSPHSRQLLSLAHNIAIMFVSYFVVLTIVFCPMVTLSYISLALLPPEAVRS